MFCSLNIVQLLYALLTKLTSPTPYLNLPHSPFLIHSPTDLFIPILKDNNNNDVDFVIAYTIENYFLGKTFLTRIFIEND